MLALECDLARTDAAARASWAAAALRAPLPALPAREDGSGVSAAIALRSAAARDAQAVRGERDSGGPPACSWQAVTGRGLASLLLFIISALPCAVTGSALAE